MVIITMKAPGAFNQDTFEGCGRWREDKEERLVVDLRSVCFVESYAMVMMLNAIWLHRLDDNDVELKLPKSRSARTYLARMHFFELLPDGVRCSEPYPTVQERGKPWIVPLTPLDFAAGEGAIDVLARFAYPQLPPRLQSSFIEAIAEITANVVQHAEAEVAFVAAQRFEKDFQGRKGPRFQLVVGDTGIGIPRRRETRGG